MGKRFTCKSKPILHKHHFLALFFCFVAHALFAQDWSGAINNDWDNPGNWNGGAVPLATGNVIIPGGVPNTPIVSTANAVAKSVHIEDGATLTVAATGILTINGAVNSALLNEGTLTNSGDIIIGSTLVSGLYGILSYGMINNNAGGEIRIDKTTDAGMYLSSNNVNNYGKITIGSLSAVGNYGLRNGSTFTNHTGGEIQIDRSSAYGLFNVSNTFTNSGKITIGSLFSVGSHGLRNNSTITNNAGGEIQIDRTTSIGVYNSSGIFHNSGKIMIGSQGNVGLFGILNESSFTNNAGGEIQIDRSSNVGLYNYDYANFGNTGKITIGSLFSVGNHGLQNNRTFTNNAGGEIQIDRSAVTGLYQSGGNFNNTGKITIGSLSSVGDNGFFIISTFTNNAGGEIQIDRSTSSGVYNSGGIFNNSGKLTIGSLANVGPRGLRNNSTFTNHAGGEIQIDRSTFSGVHNSGGNFTNTGKITIGSLASVGDYGLQNNGFFTNNAGGEIQIDQSNFCGLYHLSDNFNNSGKITIGSLGNVGQYGILNESSFTNNAGGEIQIDRSTFRGLGHVSQHTTFNNSGKITIGSLANVGDYGMAIINVYSTFNNNIGGEIQIDRASTGLTNEGGAYINFGKITIGSLANNVLGLLNYGTFFNKTNAEINIDRCTNNGMTTQHEFTNEGKIIIGALASVGERGIQNHGILNNNEGGEINIDRVLNQYLDNRNRFNNAGKITIAASENSGLVGLRNTYIFSNNAGGEISIADVADYGLENLNNFNNNACAIIRLLAPVNNLNTGSINNNGLFSVNTTDQHINGNVFNNNGILEYPQGNPIPNVTNQEVIVAPVSGECGVFPNVLQIAGLDQFTVAANWYQDENLSIPAGTYDQNSNTFTVTNLSEGNTYTLFFSVEDDNNACPRTVSISLTFNDLTPPEAHCKNVSVEIQPNDEVGVAPNDVNDNSTDNCEIENLALDLSTFNCLQLGDNAVVLSVTDIGGMTSTCAAIVTVSDPNHYCCAAPNAICQNTSVQLDEDGLATIEVADVDNGSSYECGLASISVSPTGADCADIGTPITATLTVLDVNGLTASCTAVVTVLDLIKPAITCPGNTTVAANGTCSGAVGSYSPVSLSDNCTTNPTVTQSPASNTVLSGHNDVETVTLTADDGNGNTESCTFTVTLKDISKPVITCPSNTTVAADGTCSGAVGSYSPVSLSDNCTTNPTVTQSPASSTVLSGHNDVETVTLTADDGNGNTQFCTFTVTLKDISKPSITCPSNTTVAADGTCSGTVGSYSPAALSDNCTTNPTVTQSPASSTVLSGHNDVETVTLTADDGNGNTESCTFTVTLKDISKPVITCPSNTTVAADGTCSGTVGSYSPTALSDNCTTNPTVTQSPASSTVLSGHNDMETVTLTADDGNGNTHFCTFTVTLKDVTQPNITCPSNTTVAADGTCSGTVGSYSPTALSDNCTTNPTVTQSPASSTVLSGHNDMETVTLTADDGNGNTHFCTFTVTLKDVIQPNITCPSNTTVAADGACSGTVGSYSPATLSDNCTTNPTVTQSPASSTVLIGHNDMETVTLTANDGNGNTHFCTFTVTLKDVTQPNITCPSNTTVAADGACSGTVGSYSPATLSDNCTTNPTVTQSPASSTVLSGHNDVETVTLTANDGNGNTHFCTFTVTLKDVTQPNITCPSNTTVAADGTCSGTVGSYSPATLSDNCTTNPTVTQSPASSTVLSGHNDMETVTLTADDGNGNTQFCTFTVTLKDVTQPNITCPSNTTVAADGACSGTVGSYSPTALSDNCTTNPTVTQSPASSTVLSGHNDMETVTLTADDGNGNTHFCTFTVTLKDVIQPNITCPSNTTVAADGACSGTVGSYSPATLSDNCTTNPTVTQSPASSTVLSGHNDMETVTLTADDGNGNSANCTLTVTLKDVTAPTITCPSNATVNANASCQGTVGAYTATSLSDNCNPSPTVTQSPASSTLLTGHNSMQTITLTANDGNGNSANCTLTVTLKDVTAPSITCPASATVNVGANCTTNLAAYAPTSMSDNCSVPTAVQSPAAGTLLSGHNTVQTVTMTATDGAGNSRTCTFTVTLKDVTAPSIVCKNATVNLIGNTVTITPVQVYQSGSDNCGVVNLQSVTPNTFNCSNIGNNTVVLTANDGNGNSATCSAVVTVRDITPPTAVCKTTILNADLNVNGTVTVLPSAINNGSSDNCSFTLSLTPSTFSCANIGLNTVTLRATDTGGNTATCTAKVRVRDLIKPTARCKNPTIFLDNQGQATLTIADVNNNSTDACGIASMTLSQTQYSCAELSGSPWSVTLSMTDVNGNSASCLAYVTVNDIIAPEAECEDVIVQLGANGRVMVYGANLAFNSTDNCSVWSYSPTAKLYTSANLGPNNLTVTVRDYKGNASTCVSVVTVLPFSSNNLVDPSGSDQGADPTHTGAFDFVVYPNPTSGEANLAMDIAQDETILIRIFDLNGRLIYQQETEGVSGENVFRLNLAELKSGLYVIEVQSGVFKGTKRLLKQD